MCVSRVAMKHRGEMNYEYKLLELTTEEQVRRDTCAVFSEPWKLGECGEQNVTWLLGP